MIFVPVASTTFRCREVARGRCRGREGWPEKHRKRHVERGKIATTRERVERLLDPGSPFLEIGQLAPSICTITRFPGAGMIAGIGRVSASR
jgi:3-methylcrotonyl-CoA carboxylase beta subunit